MCSGGRRMYTHDVGYLDEDSFLFIVNQIGLILSDGFNVCPDRSRN